MNFNMPLGVLHDLIFLVLTLGFGTHYQYTTCLEKVISALDIFSYMSGVLCIPFDCHICSYILMKILNSDDY
jgi:hypothetical protein